MKTIAYVNSFVPAEWIAAHGLQPHRLRLCITDAKPLPAVTRGICPYVGVLNETVLSGLDASALVLTTVCDQMRYAAALLETRGSCPVFLLNVPSTWQTTAVRRLYRDELQRLGRFLVQLGGKTPDNAKLIQTLLAYDRERNTSMRWGGRLTSCWSSSITATPTKGACWGDSCAVAPTKNIPLAILGGPLLETDGMFFDIIEQAGGCVALDATEGGERTMPRPFDPARVASDPLTELADAYFDIPAPFRRPNILFYEWLGREIAARRVRGIILRRYLWCDLWHAELQRLKQWSALPVLELDVGPDDAGAPNRVQGRIEAFLETLR